MGNSARDTRRVEIDHDEEEHRLNCFARWMLDHWTTQTERRSSLARMHETHGKDMVDDLKQRIMSEWRVRKQ